MQNKTPERVWLSPRSFSPEVRDGRKALKKRNADHVEYIRADLVEAGVELWDQISHVLTDLDFRWGDFYEVSPRDAVEHIEEAINGLEQIIERQDNEIARLKEKPE